MLRHIPFTNLTSKSFYVPFVVCLVVIIGIIVIVARHNEHKLPPGIYIDGPTTVSIRTPQPYDYTVEVVPDKTVKDANVLISVPENSTGVRKVINLTYGHPWLYDLKVTFESTAGMTSEGIAAGFFSPATKTEPVASFHDDFLLTPAITSN